MAPSEKNDDAIQPAASRNSTSSNDVTKIENAEEAFEVFKRGDGAVDFRTVGWIHASVIFLKRTAPSSLLNPSSRDYPLL